MPWDLAESQRIAGKCWPKVGGFFANQASKLHMHVHMHVHNCTCTCTCTCACTCAHVHVHMHALHICGFPLLLQLGIERPRLS